jgi:hypothetical protein
MTNWRRGRPKDLGGQVLEWCHQLQVQCQRLPQHLLQMSLPVHRWSLVHKLFLLNRLAARRPTPIHGLDTS